MTIAGKHFAQGRNSATLATMNEIVFIVRAEEDGGFSASWNDPAGGGISTQGDDLAEHQEMIRDAIECYFDVAETDKPKRLEVAREGIEPPIPRGLS